MFPDGRHRPRQATEANPIQATPECLPPVLLSPGGRSHATHAPVRTAGAPGWGADVGLTPGRASGCSPTVADGTSATGRAGGGATAVLSSDTGKDGPDPLRGSVGEA
ncbi:hypothetical protein KRMM14A1004_42450 [Krasilnikovia sp. MM14-A1004]